jgi:hypothetical protein
MTIDIAQFQITQAIFTGDVQEVFAGFQSILLRTADDGHGVGVYGHPGSRKMDIKGAGGLG